MQMLFRATRTTDVVIGGATPATDAEDDEIEAYEDIVQETLLIFMQVLDKKILQTVSTLEHPHQIWVKLEHAFFRNTAFSFVSQMAQLNTFSARFSPKGTNLPAFIEKFEDEWNKLYHLAIPPIPTSHHIGMILSASYPMMMQRENFSLLLSLRLRMSLII
jgi:hypothetical protein